MDDQNFVTQGVYQLQYGTQLCYQGSEVLEQPCMVNREWSSFSFVPGRQNSLMFHQSGSNKLLYTSLPTAADESALVLHFGSHTGKPQLNETKPAKFAFVPLQSAG